MTKEEALTDMARSMMEKFREFGLLRDIERYWNMRGELAARSLCVVFDNARTDTIRGQMTICYEMEDLARQTRESAEAKAKGNSDEPISVNTMTAI